MRIFLVMSASMWATPRARSEIVGRVAREAHDSPSLDAVSSFAASSINLAASRARVALFVGDNDPLHEWVSHHVDFGEAVERDAFDILEQPPGFAQAARRPAWQIDLRHIAGDHRLGVVAETGEEHAHLLAGGVLRLVEDHEAVVEGASAHECKRGDLDLSALEHGVHAGGIHHVVERVVERTEVRVDLLLEIAGQKTQPLAGFHGGPREDDASHLLGGERLHRDGHREVGPCRCRRGRSQR